jgi:hypothetical protein
MMQLCKCLPLTILKSVISPIKIVDKYRAFFVRTFSAAFCYSHFFKLRRDSQVDFFFIKLLLRARISD